MAVLSNRKVFLITIFVLFTILYWAVFFPLLWIHTKSRVTHIVWITVLLAAVLLFIVLVIITWYLVKKYNWWINAGGQRRTSPADCPQNYKYGFQYLHHLYSSQQWYPAHHNQRTLDQSSTHPHDHQGKDHQQSVELAVRKGGSGVQRTVPTNEICEVIVDKRILQDAETQTDRDSGSISPGIYRTSLIMDVNREREPRSPSGDSTRSSQWFYPTLADYYKDKTLKLRVRMDKAQHEGAVLRQSVSLDDQVDYAIPDTRLFLKREQVYSNLEIK